MDVIHAVGRTGWSKNGAAREPRPCGALLSGQGSAARPCPLELFPGVVFTTNKIKKYRRDKTGGVKPLE